MTRNQREHLANMIGWCLMAVLAAVLACRFDPIWLIATIPPVFIVAWHQTKFVGPEEMLK